MNIEKRLKYKLLIGGFIIFIFLLAALTEDNEKVVPLTVNGQQEFVVNVKNEDLKEKAHNFLIEIEKGKRWITFLKKIYIKKGNKWKWVTIKSNKVKVGRGKSIPALFSADGNKMRWGRIYEGLIKIKCLDCKKPPYKLPESVKVIAIKDERILRKAWLTDTLKQLAKIGLKNEKGEEVPIKTNIINLVVVKGDLPGTHGGGGRFIPGKPKWVKTGNIPSFIKNYEKHIYDWNKKNPNKPKKIDKKFVKILEDINKKTPGNNVIVISTDAAPFNPGSKSLGKLDKEEKAFMLLAALHELKHQMHKGKGMSGAQDEMEIFYWQLFSKEVRKHLSKFAGKTSIPRNAKRMFLETYFHYWKEANKFDKQKVFHHKRKIKEEVRKFNSSLKKGERRIELPEKF